MKTHSPFQPENQPIREIVKRFILDRQARGLADDTIEIYSYYLDIFSKYCEKTGMETMRQWNPDAARFMLADFGTNHKPGGVHALFRVCRVFGYWLEAESDGRYRSALRYVQPPKVIADPIPGVPLIEINRMAAVCGSDWLGKRDRALLLFLLDTGLRAGELTALNIEDVNMSAEEVTVRAETSKSYRRRTVYFSSETARALQRYLKFHPYAHSPDAPFWINRYRKRATYQTIDEILFRLSKRAGLERQPSPHDFRRAFALALDRAGVSIHRIARLMGHASIETTRRYLAINNDDLRESFRAAAPAAQLEKLRRRGKAGIK